MILDNSFARLSVARLERVRVALVPRAQVGVERNRLRLFCGVSERPERERGVDLLGDLLCPALVRLGRADALLLAPSLEVGLDPPSILEPAHLRRHYLLRLRVRYFAHASRTIVATETPRSAAISSSASICVPSHLATLPDDRR